ncbi:MAG: permease-like cell division protein FtsX [Acidimicrobiia bacterium]|nr:permease-like cell division protein FtsX [Acidimicrobiia bacterium]
MRDLDQELRESLRNRAEDVDATMTAPADLRTRVRQRRHRKIAALTSTAAVIALVAGFAGLQITGGDDAQKVTAAAPSLPEEIVAQRADGSIVVVETATGTEIRELVPPGQVDIAYRDNYIVSPDGQSVYYVESPSGADVEIFMNVDVSDTQLAELQALLEADADVVSVEFIDRDAALAEFEQTFADDPSLVENIRPEDLPPSFRIDAASPHAKDAITDRYSETAGVDQAVSAPGGFAPGSQMVASPIFRVGIEGTEPEMVGVGTNPTISPDGAILAVGSVSGDPGDLGVTDRITLYDVETGEARTAHSEDLEAAEMVWPVGWVDDSTLVVGGLEVPTFQPGADTSPLEKNRYLLDVADPDLRLRPDGALDIGSSSFVTNHGSVITSVPAPGVLVARGSCRAVCSAQVRSARSGVSDSRRQRSMSTRPRSTSSLQELVRRAATKSGNRSTAASPTRSSGTSTRTTRCTNSATITCGPGGFRVRTTSRSPRPKRRCRTSRSPMSRSPMSRGTIARLPHKRRRCAICSRRTRQ